MRTEALPLVSNEVDLAGELPLEVVELITVGNVPNVILVGDYENLELIVIIVVEGVGVFFFTEETAYTDINGIVAFLVGIGSAADGDVHQRAPSLVAWSLPQKSKTSSVSCTQVQRVSYLTTMILSSLALMA